MKALVWPVAKYGCGSWTLRKNEETRLDAFEMNVHFKCAYFTHGHRKADKSKKYNLARLHYLGSYNTLLGRILSF